MKKSEVKTFSYLLFLGTQARKNNHKYHILSSNTEQV